MQKFRQLLTNTLFMALFGVFCTTNNAHAIFSFPEEVTVRVNFHDFSADSAYASAHPLGDPYHTMGDCEMDNLSWEYAQFTCTGLTDVAVIRVHITGQSDTSHEYNDAYIAFCPNTSGSLLQYEYGGGTFDDGFECGGGSTGSGGSSGGSSSGGNDSSVGQILDFRDGEYTTFGGDDGFTYFGPASGDYWMPYYFCGAVNAPLNGEPYEILYEGDIVRLGEDDIYYCCNTHQEGGSFVHFGKNDFDEESLEITYDGCGYIGMTNLNASDACRNTGYWKICGGTERSELPQEAGYCLEENCTKMTHCRTGYYKDLTTNTCKDCDDLYKAMNMTCNKNATTIGYTNTGSSVCYIPSNATCTDDTGTLTLTKNCYF